jgi:non-ribosomal peptide synthetase-like protein
MPEHRAGRLEIVARAARVAVTIAVIFIVEVLVLGLAALPSVAAWALVLERIGEDRLLRTLVQAFLIAPAYVAFAIALMGWSALATRVTGARTPANAEYPIAELSWPLLRWARYMVSTHLVRICAGTVFRGSPLWTAYLRLNGARIGRGVYVNTLAIVDHNLLELGDGVVIGDDVHLSGHTVEAGVLKTGRVSLGPGVTVGVGTIIDIDVHVGAKGQIGALSFVPKHARLQGHAVYAGIPIRRLNVETTRFA